MGNGTNVAMKIAVADIGGTHARFALATLVNGAVASLDKATVFSAAQYSSLESAWNAFTMTLGEDVPRHGAFAIAAPVECAAAIGGQELRLANSAWHIRPASLQRELGLDRLTLVNDFGAVAHAVAKLPDQDFHHICGPDIAVPRSGVISICGPGTGLGVSAVLRTGNIHHVIATEGGHQDFAPLDSIEDRLAGRLRERHGRVSIERVVAGPAIVAIYQTLAEIENSAVPALDDRAIWSLAMDDHDDLALAAVERFFLSLGAVAGDLALAHGARAVVIAGGLALRLRDRFSGSGFAARFSAKGRFESLMATVPVKLVTHPNPGLYGAAVAFAQEHGL